MKLIAHEMPLQIMSSLRDTTDYDYALVHLFEENEEYFDFFVRSLEDGRRVILDNSVFELGKAFDPLMFASWICKLHPTEYVVPDVFEDCEATIKSFHSWCDHYNKLPGNVIGVIQGKSYDEIVKCYQEIMPYCDKLAISFKNSYYEELFPHPNKFVSWMMGRVLLISKLLKDNIININKSHHLLGVALPQEMMFYRDKKFDFIKSIDTSNPIVSGLVRQRYIKEGLWDKCMTPLVKFMNEEVSRDQFEDILFNISQFKSFVNG
jgi:hypothetical protein